MLQELKLSDGEVVELVVQEVNHVTRLWRNLFNLDNRSFVSVPTTSHGFGEWLAVVRVDNLICPFSRVGLVEDLGETVSVLILSLDKYWRDDLVVDEISEKVN